MGTQQPWLQVAKRPLEVKQLAVGGCYGQLVVFTAIFTANCPLIFAIIFANRPLQIVFWDFYS
jgi:hypothetical protein